MGVNGIYGLSGSGMDIESLVKVGMMSKQNEYDKMAQKYTKNEWMKSDYFNISNTITTFNNSTLHDYKLSSTMNAKIAESSNSAVKVTAGSSAANATHRVEVTDLSTNAYLISTAENITRLNSSAPQSADLKDVLFSSFSVDADNETVTYTTNTVSGKARTVTNKLDETAFSFTLSNGNGSESKEISFTFKEINEGASLNNLASKIKNSGLNITASYDAGKDTFFISNTKSGEGNDVSISFSSTKNPTSSKGDTIYSVTNAMRFFNSLGLQQSKDGELVPGTTAAFGKTSTSYTVNGEDGHIKVDGKTYTLTDNKATVDGVTYTALDKTSSTAVVTISQDTDAIIDKVKSFVSDYNKLLSSLYEKYDEKADSNYKPLTQSQKDSMKEDQIEKWEEKAKKGMLYHDQTLGKIIQNMRSAVTSKVEGLDSDYNSVFSLGISTTGLKGQLVLDEDKLKKALSEDSEAVYNVFAKLGNKTKTVNGQSVEDTSYNGIAQRLGDILTTATRNIRTRAGSSADITEDSDLNNLMRNLQTRMSNFKRMMRTFEDALYKRYDKMESMLAKLGTQLSFVMGGNS
ncbi:MAG: flagellar filament capping protein FliD [Selenomonadaceae bacterium]|nr:flagellar filament capping protein FliD [Selenomonadaceae bacterium]